MGLGKTIEAGLIARELLLQRRGGVEGLLTAAVNWATQSAGSAGKVARVASKFGVASSPMCTLPAGRRCQPRALTWT